MSKKRSDPHLGANGAIKKPPVSRAIDEIKYFQEQHTGILVPRACIKRLVKRSLEARLKDKKARIKKGALDKLHLILEAYAVTLFKASQKMAIHAHRVTIKKEDLIAALQINTILIGHEEPLKPSAPRKERVRNAPIPQPKERQVEIEVEQEQEQESEDLEDLLYSGASEDEMTSYSAVGAEVDSDDDDSDYSLEMEMEEELMASAEVEEELIE